MSFVGRTREITAANIPDSCLWYLRQLEEPVPPRFAHLTRLMSAFPMDEIPLFRDKVIAAYNPSLDAVYLRVPVVFETPVDSYYTDLPTSKRGLPALCLLQQWPNIGSQAKCFFFFTRRSFHAPCLRVALYTYRSRCKSPLSHLKSSSTFVHRITDRYSCRFFEFARHVWSAKLWSAFADGELFSVANAFTSHNCSLRPMFSWNRPGLNLNTLCDEWNV